MKRFVARTLKAIANFYQRFVGTRWMLFIAAILIAEAPIFQSYSLNAAETSVQDLLLPMFLSLLSGSLVAFVCLRWFTKNKPLVFFLAISLSFIANASSDVLAWASSASTRLALPTPLVDVAVFCLLAGGVYALARLLERLAVKFRANFQEVMGVMFLAAAGYFLAAFVPAFVSLATAWPQFFYKPPPLAVASSASAKPDIYYILLEDYANQTTLKSQLNFDNSNFLDQLATEGFYNSPGALSNYPYTVNSVASTFNANYLSDMINKFSSSGNQTLVPYFSTVKNSPVISQLKSMGYSYHLLGDWYETSNSSPLADRSYVQDNQIVFMNHAYTLNDFTDLRVQKNIFWYLFQAGVKIGSYRVLGYNSQDDISMVKSQLAQLHSLAAQPAGGRLIFAQILAPHNEFYFNADGSLNNNPDPNNLGKSVAAKYTGEIQYMNSQIQSLVTQIKKNSGGKANIVIQSDEGPPVDVLNNNSAKPLSLDSSSENMAKWPKAQLQAKFGVLASYYVPGASDADLAAAADPVNIFRLIFNVNFGSKLSYLPRCYYAFPQGENEAFVYQSINKALTGQANASCPANGNFINPGPTKLIKPTANDRTYTSDENE